LHLHSKLYLFLCWHSKPFGNHVQSSTAHSNNHWSFIWHSNTFIKHCTTHRYFLTVESIKGWHMSSGHTGQDRITRPSAFQHLDGQSRPSWTNQLRHRLNNKSTAAQAPQRF
jgi:hypothetical protein